MRTMWKTTEDATQTVMIYDNGMEVKFVVLDGDFTHLDGVYANSDSSENDVDKLVALLYEPDLLTERVDFLDKFPTDAVRGGAEVIVCGWNP